MIFLDLFCQTVFIENHNVYLSFPEFYPYFIHTYNYTHILSFLSRIFSIFSNIFFYCL